MSNLVWTGHQSAWDYAHAVARQIWLAAQPAPTSTSRLDQVRGWLEAIYHSSELQQWPQAQAIACQVLPSGLPLHEQLGIWGYYDEQINLYQTLKGRVSLEFDGLCLQGLGQTALWAQKLDLAKAAFSELAQWGERVGDRRAPVKAAGGLAMIAMNQSFYQQGRDLIQPWLAKAQDLRDPEQIALALSEQGIAQVYCGRSKPGMADLVKAWAIAEPLQQPALSSKILRQIAHGYIWINQPDRALPYLEQGSILSQAQEDVPKVLDAEHVIARCEYLLGQYDLAIARLQSALLRLPNYPYPMLSASLTSDLGVMYAYGLRDYARAIPYFQQATQTLKQIGHLHWSITIANEAYCHAALQQLDRAQACIQQALNQIQHIDPDTQGAILACLAKVQWEQGHYLRAFWYIGQAFITATPWRSANGGIIWRQFWQHLYQAWVNQWSRWRSSSLK